MYCTVGAITTASEISCLSSVSQAGTGHRTKYCTALNRKGPKTVIIV